MSKSAILLIAAIVPLTAGACTATNGGAQFARAARPGDAAYCQSLVNLYEPADLDAKVAIAQCQEGNPGPAIPVLQQKLRDSRVAVPPRA
jgi:hypothetical protein